MADYTQMKPLSNPIPVALRVECPACGKPVEYEPAEDDAGAFHAEQDWPCCDDCEVLIDVPPVRVVPVDGVYFARNSRT